jgi:hypothetical protein
MYTVTHGGTIQKGDLIAIADGNDFHMGIYYGRGVGGTVQYYCPLSIPHTKAGYDRRVAEKGIEKEGPFKLNLLWKNYINTPRETRIIKLNRENITNEGIMDSIIESKEILKEFNIHVNY